MNHMTDFFADPAARMTLTESLEMTAQSLNAYGSQHPHWFFAWSGGKDSTATVSVALYLIDQGEVAAPETITVFYADTRLELPPLSAAAYQMMDALRRRGVNVQVVMAPMDDRYFVYMLGRGVPPPNNMTFRWCTPQMKVEPMERAIDAYLNQVGTALMITGVRLGESAIRDRRITLACSKDGGECGQGWYQNVLPNAKGVRGRVATLAPLLHWRVCHVWGWLLEEMSGLPTAALAEAYGGDEAEEINARTGCIGCPLAQRDTALENIIKRPKWSHLSPLLGLKPIYRELRKPQNRLRKTELEKRKDGQAVHNPNRMGPLTMPARRWALGEVLAIQDAVNRKAAPDTRIDILNSDEHARILELMERNTWPDKWSGDEQRADLPFPAYYRNGIIQPLLVG